ncbi:hypothetical protein PBOI14_19340 [Pseudomonas sp. Boi14]|nr:hypothetical protein PBOI14_19340 [Pseudomonas sp. Boi14]
MLFRRFEQLIDIFRDAPSATPPNRVLPFYFHYIKQVWPSFVALLVVGLFVALIEVSLFSYLSTIIDLAQGTPASRCSPTTAWNWPGWRWWRCCSGP